ncbi:MAG: hypothetical protein M3162_00365 [Thermoproteota archaeon]|nr:hypothetical protein [Thermoproteota archaeon]
MHGPDWLEVWLAPVILLAAGGFFLYLSIKTQKEHRIGQHNELHSGIEISVFDKRIIDTNKGWIFFTLFLGGMALGAHVVFEYILHMYDTTPIDSFTHGLSAMGITAIVLNLYLTKKRRLYYPISIVAAWIGFILWEIYEWIQVSITGASGFIQTEPIDMAVDLWVDTLGALSVCFIYDEFTD